MKKIEDKTITGIFKNIIKGILVLVYFLVINILCAKVQYNVLQNYIRVVSIILLAIAIYTFEKSYKKDNEFIFLEAVEYVIMLLHTLTIIYITSKYKIDLRKYVVLSAYIFASYFVLKAIIIYTKSERDYAKSLSDIPEIVKKDEPKVKEATKKKKINNQKIEKDKLENIEIKENIENKEEVKKETTKKDTSKKETTKKETTKKDTAKKETTKKETVKRETAKKETVKKDTVEKPKTKTATKVSTKKTTAKKAIESKNEEDGTDKIEKKTTKKTTSKATAKATTKKTPTNKSEETKVRKTTRAVKNNSDDKKEVKEND